MFYLLFRITGYGHRPCLENGTWFRHPESNKTWSNYTTCIDLDDFQVCGVSFVMVLLSFSLCGCNLLAFRATSDISNN